MPTPHDNLLESSRSFPVYIQDSITTALDATDELHRFVRLIASTETLIKFLAATTHACAVVHRQDRATYAVQFNDGFLNSNRWPTLGNWTLLQTEAIKALGRACPKWLTPLQHLLQRKHTNGTQLFALIDYVKKLRNYDAGNVDSYDASELLVAFNQLRNHFAHGSPTLRFAKNVNDVLVRGLADFMLQSTTLDGETKTEKTQFRLISPFCWHPTKKGLVRAHDACSHKTVDIEWAEAGHEPTPHFDDLYVGPRDATTMAEFVRLGGLVRYYNDYHDVHVFNGLANDRLRYLSYRTGEEVYEPSILEERPLIELFLLKEPEGIELAPSVPDATGASSSSQPSSQLPYQGGASDRPNAEARAFNGSPSLTQFLSQLASEPVDAGHAVAMAEDAARELAGVTVEEQDRRLQDATKQLDTCHKQSVVASLLFVGELAFQLGVLPLAEKMFGDAKGSAESPAIACARLAQTQVLLATLHWRDPKARKSYLDRAVTELRSALECQLPHALARQLSYDLVDCLLRVGKCDEALAECERGIQRFPDDTWLQRKIKMLRERSGRGSHLDAPKAPQIIVDLKIAIGRVSQAGGWAALASVGSMIRSQHPSFEPHQYGHMKLADLIRAHPQDFELVLRDSPFEKETRHPWVRVAPVAAATASRL